jgi:hypothetical protein
MDDNQNELVNKLVREEGSVAEKARIASELDDDHLRVASTHSKYAKEELENRRVVRSTEAMMRLGDKVTGLMETIYRASQGIQEKADTLFSLYDRISRSQTRQQRIVIGLTVVLALSTIAYTWITWLSVSAMRDANEIQRQVLKLQQQGSSAAQPAPNRTVETDARKSSARGSP